MSPDVAATNRIDKRTLAPLLERRDLPGLLWLAGHLGLLVATGLLIWASLGSWWLLPAMLAHGVVTIFLFAPLHECVHGTAFASAWLNRSVGWLCGLPLLLLPSYFRAFHLAHHAHTQDPRRDPELATAKPTTWDQALVYLSGYGYWAAQIRGLVLAASGHLQAHFITSRAAPAIRREARIGLAVYALSFLGSLLAGSWAILWFWVIPVLLGQPVLRAYLLAEHWDCPLIADMRRNTRTTLTNGAVRFLAWNMPYHAEHHAYPSVPFHALPRLHGLMRHELAVVTPGYLSVQRAFWRRIAGQG